MNSNRKYFSVSMVKPAGIFLQYDIYILVIGSIIVFKLAAGLLFGWYESNFYEWISIPLTYQGDGLFTSWGIQRIIEGWVYDNPRSGYPFGSNFLDYPSSDFGNLLILKAISFFSNNYVIVLNLFILLSFPAVFVAAFIVLRSLGFIPLYAFGASIIYVFAPFHFLRIPHTFYVWYFVAPLFFYLGYRIYNGPFLNNVSGPFRKFLSGFLMLTVLASFGVYYALFGVIVIGISGVAAWFRYRSYRPLIYALFAMGSVVFGVIINVSPNIAHIILDGKNTESIVRHSSGAEIYGLKLMHLVLPRIGHRNANFASITQNYNATSPLNNENTTASLGIVGSIGLVFLGITVLMKLSGWDVDDRMVFLSLVTFALFIFGTIGGLGSLFSHAISSSIRGWNRISIFIAFGAYASFFLAIQLVMLFFQEKAQKGKILISMGLIPFIGFGIYDQTVPACVSCNEQIKVEYEMDRDFIAEIEDILPVGAAIYQLPYMPFPEVPALYKLGTYDLFSGFLHSKHLRWSYGGMKGREGSVFYRSLSEEPIALQIDVLKKLGFSGIYIDRRGYKDQGSEIVAQLSNLLGAPPELVRKDDKIVFFELPAHDAVDFSNMSHFEIMEHAEYIVDKHGPRYKANYVDGIDFSNPRWPTFVRSVEGFSGPEPWGRWSDANGAPIVKIEFTQPLPNRFNLELDLQAFGPNVGKEFSIKIGSRYYSVFMSKVQDIISIPVDTKSESANSIEFHPNQPVSPAELNISADPRKLAIGFRKLVIIPSVQ